MPGYPCSILGCIPKLANWIWTLAWRLHLPGMRQSRQFSQLSHYQPRSLANQGDNAHDSVHPCVCPSVSALTPKPFDLQPWYSVCRSTLTLARMGVKVKVVGERSRSNAQIRIFTSDILPWGLGQRSGSRPKVRVKVKFLARSSQYIRGSALPSAAMGNNHHYESKVIVCPFCGCLQIIAQMRSIGF